MPVPTPELGLQKGLDADDTADYLTISLANSLTTVDSLFSNVSGHTHAGPHQGGPIGSGSISGALDIQDWYRSTGHTTAFATTGAGMEMYYDSTQGGVLQSYNRATATLLPVKLLGSTVGLYAGSGAEVLHIAADNSSTFLGTVTCDSNLTVNGTSQLTGTVTCNAISCTGFSASGNASVTGTIVVGALSTTGSVTAGALTATGSVTTATLTVSGGSSFSGTLSIPLNGLIQWAGGGSVTSSTAGYITINNLTVTGQTNLNGSVSVGGNLTTPGQVSAFQYNIGPNGQYIFPVSTSIRYAAAAGGVHSFEYVGGGMAPCGASAFTVGSARRLKTNIVALVDPLEIVTDERVHGVSYTEIASGEQKVGFVADDWLGVLPSVVALDDMGDVEALDYDRISAVTFEALKAFVARTEARLAALETAA